MPGSPTTTRLRLTSTWKVKLNAWTVEVTQHVSHQGCGCVRHRRPLQQEAAQMGRSSQVKAGQGKSSQGRKRSGRDGAIKGHQGSSGVIRVRSERTRWSSEATRPAAGSRSCRANQGSSVVIIGHHRSSVVIRGDQTCSRKQIMSSQLRMKGSVTRSSSRIFSNGPLSFSGPPALRSTLNSAGM